MRTGEQSGEVSRRVLLKRRFRLGPRWLSEGDSRVSCCGAAKCSGHMGETLMSRGASGVGDGMKGPQLVLALAEDTTAAGEEMDGAKEEDIVSRGVCRRRHKLAVG